MKHQFFKAYSFLFYFLSGITSFFIGLSYAGIIEARKGQMLAGGAIVLGYGVIAGCIGFLLSIFVVYKSNRKIIIRVNILLTICIAAFYIYYHLKYKERQKVKELENQKTEQRQHKTPTKVNETAMLLDFEINSKFVNVKLL
ncbi:hypothetical protein [Psychroserpens sp.]